MAGPGSVGSEGFSRRRFVGAAGLGAAAAGAIAAGLGGAPRPAAAAPPSDDPGEPADTVDFDGAHQAGIATPPQDHARLVGLDLAEGATRERVRNLMRVWTDDARRLCAGSAPLGSLEPEIAASPGALTVTVGLGPGFFERLGLQAERPAWLGELEHFAGDELEDRWGQTDLVLQLCGNDRLALSYASRHLLRAAAAIATTAWVQEGFLPTGGHGRGTPRNLFGQKDGTVNPRGDHELAEQVWIDSGPNWLMGGTAMVVRRISMDLDGWQALDRASRERALGRDLKDGAPLSGGGEFNDIDTAVLDERGLPKVDKFSHAARATPPRDKPGQRLLRRSYSYADTPVPGESGLVFVCFQKDPGEQFVPIQRRLAEADRMSEWFTHVGSAVYAVPRGAENRPGGFLAAGLLGAG